MLGEALERAMLDYTSHVSTVYVFSFQNVFNCSAPHFAKPVVVEARFITHRTGAERFTKRIHLKVLREAFRMSFGEKERSPESPVSKQQILWNSIASRDFHCKEPRALSKRF